MIVELHTVAASGNTMEPDWAELHRRLKEAVDWLNTEDGVHGFDGPVAAAVEVFQLCRYMIAPYAGEPDSLLWVFADRVNSAAHWLLQHYEPDSDERNRIVCLTSGGNMPAQRFGGWSSWSTEEVSYLLHELSDGHWDNCGEKVEGFAVATGGLNIAIAANESGLDDEGLRRIVNGMWAAADFLVGFRETSTDPRIVQSLEAVADACEWTGVPGPDAVGITCCALTLR